VLGKGLESSSLIFSFALLRKECVNEDALDAAISLFRMFVSQHLVCSCNQTAHVHYESQKEYADGSIMPPTKKRRITGGDNDGKLHSALKKIYRVVLGYSSSFLVLMEKLLEVVESVPLEDHQILMITNGALCTLEMEFAMLKCESEYQKLQQIQLASIDVLVSAFQKYTAHRGSIMEDVFPVLLKIPTSKRTSRMFAVSYSSAPSPAAVSSFNQDILSPILPSLSQPHMIQMATALVIAMVQSCVQRPSYATDANSQTNTVAMTDAGADTSADTGATKSTSNDAKLVSGLSACKAVASLFTSHLISRCLRVKDGAAEYRPVLSNLVDDLLVLLIIPQYPAAEMMLLSIVGSVQSVLQTANRQQSSSSSTAVLPDSTFLTFAFDILGKITSVQAKLLAAHRSRPISTGARTYLPSSSDEIEANCHCGQQQSDTFLVNCDRCHLYYHGTCVGIASDSIPEEWFCDSCSLQNIAIRQNRCWLGSVEDVGAINDIHVLRQAYISSLCHKLGTPGAQTASDLHMAGWIDSIHAEALQNTKSASVLKRMEASLMTEWGSTRPTGESLSEEGGLRLVIAMIVRASPLFAIFRQQLSFLLNLMSGSPLPSMRKLCLKTVEKVSISINHPSLFIVHC
jgi:cohesin loading factor subunit SCC2